MYRAAKRRGKYLPLLTDSKANNCFRIYQTSEQPAPTSSFCFLRNQEKTRARNPAQYWEARALRLMALVGGE